jgi:pimeloyl-ACP methyl ester carboxylesterase
MSTTPHTDTITGHEMDQVKRANATGLQPVVFVHGLWLLPNSWERWASFFEEAGYSTLAPGWPDDPETVDEAKAHPEIFADKTVGQIADHVDRIIRQLNKKPALIGHSFAWMASCRGNSARVHTPFCQVGAAFPIRPLLSVSRGEPSFNSMTKSIFHFVVATG